MILKKYPWLFDLMVIALCVTIVGRAASILLLIALQRERPPGPRWPSKPQMVAPQPRPKDLETVLDEERKPPFILCSLPAEPNPSESSGLEIDVDKGVRCHGSRCEIDKSLIDKVLANTTALTTWARFVPSRRDNKPNGFKLYAIRPGSLFAKIGMQNADLLKAINGLDLSTPDQALEAYVKLKTASHLTVLLERRGKNRTLDYQIR